MSYIPSSYTSEDKQAIIDAYSNDDGSINYDSINDAISTGDETYADIEDLISFYLENLQELPEALSDLENPDSYADLWASDSDGSLSDTLNIWKMNFSYLSETTDDATLKEYYNSIISDLESYLEDGEAKQDLVEDIASFIDDVELSYELADADSDSESDGDTIVLTDAVDWALKVIGSPALAILFYITGSTMVEEDEDGNKVAEYKNTGLAEVVQDFQVEVIDQIQDMNSELDDLTSELASLDWSDTEQAQADSEEIKRQMKVIENVLSVDTSLMTLAQDFLASLQEAAANLERTQFMTSRSVTS